MVIQHLGRNTVGMNDVCHQDMTQQNKMNCGVILSCRTRLMD